jgi:NAD(P)-dependent dehydrogenase (short-subunit alcohol dehydrogenase family)
MKCVIVAGASRGIGFDTALAFGHAGYKVYATMRNVAMTNNLRQIISGEPLNITMPKMDVDSDESDSTCINTILQENDSLDVLVNNAGIERHAAIRTRLGLMHCHFYIGGRR